MRLTLSALPRAQKCPSSCVLPAVRDNSAEFRDAGTARHAYLCDVPKMGRDAALARVPEEHRLMCECLDIERLPLDSALFQQEVALSYSMRSGTVRLLGYDIGRKYEVDWADELPGSLDVMGLIAEGVVYVADYKGSHDDSMEPAKHNMQLRAQAVLAAKHTGATRAVIEFIHLCDDGTHYADRDEMDELDLATVEEEMRRIFESVAAQSAQVTGVTRGKHCAWCPAYVVCPGTLALARSLFTAPESWAETQAITPETARAAYEAVRQAEKVVTRAKEEIKRFAEIGAIDLGNGKVYGPVESETVDSGRAMGVLLKMYGEEVTQAAAKFSTSRDAISEALRPVAKARGVSLASLTRETWDAMRAAGAFRKAAKIQEHKVRE